jgi:hypothetical protein
MPDDVAEFIMLQFEKPFKTYGAMSLGQVHQRPSLIFFN